MTVCTSDLFDVPACKSRKVEVDFKGGEVSSDGGVLLLRQVDRKLKLLRSVDRQLKDPRRQPSCNHTS